MTIKEFMSVTILLCIPIAKIHANGVLQPIDIVILILGITLCLAITIRKALGG
jgi:hypothetical protein